MLLVHKQTKQTNKQTNKHAHALQIADEDLEHIKHLAEQVLAIAEYRAELYDYLKNRCALVLQ